MRKSITRCRSEIGRYEVPREEFLPGLAIRMTIDDFQIAGVRHDVTESLKSEIFNRLWSKVIYVKDTELIKAKIFGIAAVALFL